MAAFVNQVRLLCYGLGASVGRYAGQVRILLAASRRGDAARHRRGESCCCRALAQEGARDLVPAATGLDLRAADRRALFHAARNFRRDRPSGVRAHCRLLDPLPARLLRQARDAAAAHPARIRDRMDERHPVRLPDAVLVGGVERSVAAFAAARRDGDPRCRQAMDVEDPASRTARARSTRFTCRWTSRCGST